MSMSSSSWGRAPFLLGLGLAAAGPGAGLGAAAPPIRLVLFVVLVL